MPVYVTYLHLLPSTIVSGRKVHHLLDFITGPVRVFPKDDAVFLSWGGQSHESVTGGGPHVTCWMDAAHPRPFKSKFKPACQLAKLLTSGLTSSSTYIAEEHLPLSDGPTEDFQCQFLFLLNFCLQISWRTGTQAQYGATTWPELSRTFVGQQRICWEILHWFIRFSFICWVYLPNRSFTFQLVLK